MSSHFGDHEGRQNVRLAIQLMVAQSEIVDDSAAEAVKKFGS